MLTPIELPEDVLRSMYFSAKQLHNRFRQVGQDDIVQEMWVWALTHPKSVDRYLATGERNKLKWAFRNAGLKFCQAEKARLAGYSPDDNYYYSVKALKELLPAVYDDDAWTRLGSGDCDPQRGISPDPARPDRRMDAIAALTDVKVAIRKLPPETRSLIEKAYRDEFSMDQLAGFYETTPDGARMRLQRAVRRLQRELGGERPH